MFSWYSYLKFRKLKIYYLYDYGLTFGVSITDTTGEPIPLDPKYFTLDIAQTTTKKINGYYQFIHTSLGYKLWDSNDLPNLSPEYIARGLKSSLYWPVSKGYKVAGNYLSNNYQFITVIIKTWTGLSCKTPTQIAARVADTVVSLAVSNKYMDFTDFDTPVKPYLDDRNYFYLDPTATKVWRVYLQQNEAITNDDYLKIKSASDTSFFSIEKKTIVDSSIYSSTLINISLMLGPNKSTYSRTVFTIMDLFGNVGGIYGLLQSVWGILVGIVSTQIMLASVFRRLYYTNKTNFENLFIKVSERTRKAGNMPAEETKGQDLKSRFMSILSRNDESKSTSEIEIKLEDKNKMIKAALPDQK